MAFCIMRTQKIKSVGGVCAAISHAFRDRETPNADKEKTAENWYFIGDTQTPNADKENTLELENVTKSENETSLIGENTPEKLPENTPENPVPETTAEMTENQRQREKMAKQAIAKFKKELPEKIRKNAVVGVELMMTFSPEWKESPNYTPEKYLQACDKWATDLFGEKNIIMMSHHYDETTPHTSIIVCPKDENGKLNCRKFLGGTRHRMSFYQDDFYEHVGKQFGLDRGVRGSKAKHEDIKKFYGAIQDTKKEAYDISTQITQSLPEKGILEGNRAYTEKVKAQIVHELTPIVAKHLNAPSERQHTRELNRSLARTIERTTEETRQAVAEKVTQELTSNYSADLEKAVQERTQEQTAAAERAQKALRELQKANLLKEQEEKAEKAKKAKEEKEKKEREAKAETERKEKEAQKEREHQEEIEKYQDILYKSGVITLEEDKGARYYDGEQFIIDEEANAIPIPGGVAYAAKVADEIIREKSPAWFRMCAEFIDFTQTKTLENAIVVFNRPFEAIEPGDVFSPAVIELHEDKAGEFVTITDKTKGITKMANPLLSEAITSNFEPESKKPGSRYEISVWSLDETGMITSVFTEENLKQDEKPKRANEPKVLELKRDIKEEKQRELERERKKTMHR